jgi:hypothetical protein
MKMFVKGGSQIIGVEWESFWVEEEPEVASSLELGTEGTNPELYAVRGVVA